MSLYSQLFLRETASPYGDINRNSTLSFRDLDQNFIFLKERDIHQLRVDGSNLIYETLGGTEYSVNIGGTSTNNTFVTGFTFNSPSKYDLTIEQNQGESPLTVDLSSLASDVYVLSGSYNPSTGDVEFTNSTGGTFVVSGFTTGMTDSYTDAATLNGNTIEFDNNILGSNFYNVDLTPVISGFTTGNTLQEVLDNGSTYTGSDAISMITTSTIIDRGDTSYTAFGGSSASTGRGSTYLTPTDARLRLETGIGVYSEVNLTSASMLITDLVNTRGLVYAADYSGSYTTRSLVDKAYVDAQISAISAENLQTTLDAGSTATMTSGGFQVQVEDTSVRYSNVTVISSASQLNSQYSATETSTVQATEGIAKMRAANGSNNVEVNLNGTDIVLSAYNGTLDNVLTINTTSSVFKDAINSKGLEYAADYSSNFTNESLITKRYVDNSISGFVETSLFNTYTGDTETVLNSKLNISDFNTYSGNVQTQLDSKIETASNVGSGEGLFSGKSGTDLQFKTLTSTGGTVTITSTGDTVNLESSGGGGGVSFGNAGQIPVTNATLDDFDYTSEFTFNGTTFVVNNTNTNAYLINAYKAGSSSTNGFLVQARGDVSGAIDSINYRISRFGSSSLLFHSTSNHPLTLGAGTSSASNSSFHIFQSGNVAVGTTTVTDPSSKFWIKGSNDLVSGSNLKLVNDSENTLFEVKNDGTVVIPNVGSATPVTNLAVDASGNVVSGTTGGGGSAFPYTGDAEITGSLTINGDGNTPSTTNFTLKNSDGDILLEVGEDSTNYVEFNDGYFQVAPTSTSNTLGTFSNQSFYIGTGIAAAGTGSVNRVYAQGENHTLAGTANLNDSFILGSTHTVAQGNRSFVLGTSINIGDLNDSFVGGNTINGSTADLSKSFIWNASTTTMVLNDTSDGLVLIGSSAFGFKGDNITGIGGEHYSSLATLSKHYAFGDRIRGTVSRQTVIGMGTDSGTMLQLASGAANGVHLGVASNRPGFGLVKSTAKSMTTTATETTGLAYLGTGLPVALNVANTGDGAFWIEDVDTAPTANVANAGALYNSGGTITWWDGTTNYNLTSTGGGSGEVNTASNVGSGEGLFSGKSGVDLQFKTLTSTGGTVTITSTGDTVNLESASGSQWSDETSPTRIALTGSGQTVEIGDNSQTWNGTTSNGFLLVGSLNTIGTGTAVQRGFVVGLQNQIGINSTSFSTLIAGNSNIDYGGTANILLGSSNFTEGNQNLVAPRNNEAYGNYNVVLGRASEAGTQLSTVEDSIVIGVAANSRADDQILIGHSISTSTTWATAPGIYFGHGMSRANAGFFRDPAAATATPVNFILGGASAMRTDTTGTIKSGAGSGIFYLQNEPSDTRIIEPTTDLSNVIGMWAKNNSSTNDLGLLVKDEQGGKSWIGGRIGINVQSDGDSNAALTSTVDASLHVRGEGLTSGTTALLIENSGSTNTLFEVKNDGTVVIPTVGSTTPVTNLAVDASGNVVSGTTGGGGGSLWTDDGGGKISYSDAASGVEIYETGWGNTYEAAVTVRRGFLMVGEGHSVGHPTTATNVGRSALFGGDHNIGTVGNADWGFIAGYNNTIEEGSYNIILGNASTVKNTSDNAISIGRSNNITGSDAITIGYSNTLSSSNAIAIGSALKAGYSSRKQILVGDNIDIAASWANKGFYVGFGVNVVARPTFGLTRSTGLSDAEPLNLCMGSISAVRNDTGGAVTNAGSGVIWQFKGDTIPTANPADGVAHYTADRAASKAGYEIKVEDGTKHFFGDYSAIGGGNADANADKVLTIVGSGTGSGTSSLLCEDSAGTANFEVNDEGVSIFRSFTVTEVGSLSAVAGGFIYVSDETGGPTMAFSDGTNWRRVQDRAIVS